VYYQDTFRSTLNRAILVMMMSSPPSKFFSGVSAAVVAPFLMVLGFMIWDDDWMKKNGSAFSLNMFKCNLTALWFLIILVATNMTKEDEQSVLSTSHNGTMLSDSVKNISTKINPFQNEDVKFLFVSSTVGILIGDWVWIEGLKYLGARKVIIMDSLKPFLAAFAGWVFFNEKFNNPLTASIGLVLTVAGVALVGFEVEYEKEHNCEHEHAHEYSRVMDTDKHQNIYNTATTTDKIDDRGRKAAQTSHYGIFMSILNVVLHTLGASLTKKFGVEMTTWEINFIRFGFSGFCMLFLTVLLQIRDRILRVTQDSTRQSSEFRLSNSTTASKYSKSEYDSLLTTIESISTVPSSTFNFSAHQEARWYALPKLSRASWIRVTLGVAFVSFMNPALTNYAMFQIPLALLLTLESIGPLYTLPLTLVMHKEYPSFRASTGAAFAVIGIVLLSLQGRAN